MTTKDAQQAVKVMVLDELIQETESSLRQCQRTLEGLQQRIAIEERQRRMLLEKRNALAHSLENNKPEYDFGTTADVVAKVLLERGEPMRVREILQALFDEGFAPSDQDRLRNNVISTLTRREDMFNRISRGTYVLRSWINHEQRQQDTNDSDASNCNWSHRRYFVTANEQ